MKVVQILTDHLIQKGRIPEAERDIYAYGFDITIYTIWSTAALLLLGLLLRQFIPAAILVFGFYAFQTTGGGYHANTHLGCFLTMTAGLLVGLSLILLKGHPVFLWIFLGVGAAALLRFPLVLHPNKSYLKTEKKRLSIRSIAVTLFVLSSVIVLNVFFERMLYAFSALFLLSGISRVTGKLVYDRRNRTLPPSGPV